MGVKEVSETWQNVQYVKKAFIMETMSATLIEDQIESGNQTLRKLVAKLTVYHRNYMFVLPA